MTFRVIDIPPVDVPRAKAAHDQELAKAESDLLNFDLARLECLNSLGMWIDLFGADRVQRMLDFKIAERAPGD